jgi:methionyl-tRNA formyltransferase
MNLGMAMAGPGGGGTQHCHQLVSIRLGLLDLERPAAELARVVRALSPHLGARAVLEGRPATVGRARVADDGVFEPLEEQPDGGRRMEYAAWLRGLR